MHSTTSPSESSPSLEKPQKPTIRLATPTDASQIASLGRTVFSKAFGYSLPPSDLQIYLQTSYSVASIQADLTNPLMTVLVAISPSAPDQILGFAQLTEGTMEPCIEGKEDPIELQRLYVGLEWKGMGLGRLLVEGIEEVAREKGGKTLWLGVWEENFSAHKVYEKLGFRNTGHHDFVMGSCVQRDWIMWKSL
ncbi:hypothetical protein G7Y89_g7844 [Cudoniella acicularis]|uniref:N-acetyltransferase domain-containing protein n=1 Tax=Cudoniella acicularis TaxID=354080 RepID=A0A8H4RIJ1_9HELO|nr:hypothetical protein G7Y89_g7844 [Cudoniella acicularis]